LMSIRSVSSLGEARQQALDLKYYWWTAEQRYKVEV
jgi:hypothetical protein